MAKGFFTQGVCVLTDGQTTLEDIETALQEHGFELAKRVPAQENWCFGGPTRVIVFLLEINGHVAVDLVNRSWPDSMGDPQLDPMTFAAWSMGYFGPFAFPGGLARASQHAWSWQPARTIAERHRGFIRVRTSYVFGIEGDPAILPKNYDPLAEMMFLSRMVLALLAAPGVTCYFNPNGEVLRDRQSFHQLWDACVEKESIPLALWMNIRFFNLNEKLGFMDTVGNGQLEIRDIEAIFPTENYAPGDVHYYLRNVTHYLLDLDREIQTGEAFDGPGESDLSWTAEVLEQGVVEPPRRVLRLYPKDSREAIREALPAAGSSPK